MTKFIEIPTNPTPDRAEVFEFQSRDGAAIRGAIFAAESPRGTVVLMPGWSEFIEKYFETITNLQNRNLNVAIMDWRGQGLSDRASPRATSWRNYFECLRDDLRVFTDEHVKNRFSGPIFLLTHSMGGMPGLMLLAEGYVGFERAVLSAPMTQLFKGSANAVMMLAAQVFCRFGLANRPARKDPKNVTQFDGNIFTSDPVRHERFRALQIAEPKAALNSPDYGWVRAALKGSEKLHAPGYFDGLKTLVLIVSAGAEKQINGADHSVIASRNDLIKVHTIDGALHEILMERDDIRAQFWSAFDDFLAPALSA